MATPCETFRSTAFSTASMTSSQCRVTLGSELIRAAIGGYGHVLNADELSEARLVLCVIRDGRP